MSPRHLRSLSEELIDKLKDFSVTRLNIDGLNSGSWVIIDLFDIVIHLFIPRRREFFGIEDYWGDAPSESISENEHEEYDDYHED